VGSLERRVRHLRQRLAPERAEARRRWRERRIAELQTRLDRVVSQAGPSNLSDKEREAAAAEMLEVFVAARKERPWGA